MSKATKAAVAASLALCLATFGCSNTKTVGQDVENEGRFESEVGYTYIVTDTRTGVQYLAWRCGRAGGLCVLVDKDGKPLLEGGGE